MASTAYATTTKLAEYLGTTVGALETGSDRLLLRASELIDDMVTTPVDLTDIAHIEAVELACCAQVEYWQTAGEGIEGPIQSYQASKVQITYGAGNNRIAPVSLAPRAARFLRRAGLLYAGAVTLQ